MFFIVIVSIQSTEVEEEAWAEDHIRPHGGGCGEHQDPHSSLRPLQHRRLPRPLPGILASGRRPCIENLVSVH